MKFSSLISYTTIFILLLLFSKIVAQEKVGCSYNPMTGKGDGGNYIYTTYKGDVQIHVNDYYKPTYKNYSGPLSVVNNWNNNPNECPRHSTNYVQTGSGGSCIIDGDVNKRGNLIFYTPQKCTVPTTNVPLDNHIWLVILGVACLGTIYLSKNKLAFES